VPHEWKNDKFLSLLLSDGSIYCELLLIGMQVYLVYPNFSIQAIVTTFCSVELWVCREGGRLDHLDPQANYYGWQLQTKDQLK